MPVSYIPSAEQLVDRQKTTAKKRRRNQNAEIDELSKLLPVKPLPLSTLMAAGDGGPTDQAANGGKNQPVDKISVLRITSTFLKFQEFLKTGYYGSMETQGIPTDSRGVVRELFADALDGFLLALDKDATILFASEPITSYIGLTQHDVIGQNLVDITHPDDQEIISDNLSPKDTLPPGITNKSQDTQPRQFYIRFKCTMSPGRVQLSRFNSYTMVQVTGNLKVQIPHSGSGIEQGDRKEVVGFVGECRLIESTASILEISIPQSYFTTTISMEMRIISVESQMQELIGFSTEDFVGSRLRDYFHPADYTKLIPCEVMLMHTGHAVSPLFRFMSSNGDWVWMQMEGILRFKPGTKQRQFWEVKVKMVSQEEGRISLIEQSELYAPNPDPSQDMLNPHKDCNFLSKLNDPTHRCRSEEGAEPIVRALTGANLPHRLVEGVLHGREMGMRQLPGNVKQLLHHNEADVFKVKLRKSLADGTWGTPDLEPDSVVMSPPLMPVRSPSATGQCQGRPVHSPTPSTLSNSSATSGATPSLKTHHPVDHTHHPASSATSTGELIPCYSTIPLSVDVCSPASSHAPLQGPPSKPGHSLLSYGDVRSPGSSAVPSPASSVMASSLSPAPSSLSGSLSRGSLKRKSAPGFEAESFSFKPPHAAIASTFGNTSTNFLTGFAQVPFQDSVPSQFQQDCHAQVPFQDSIPSQFQRDHLSEITPPTSVIGSGMDTTDSELSEILENFDSNSIPGSQILNQNGDEVLQQLIMGGSPNPSTEEIRYYGSADVSNGHMISATHHMMSGDVTVSAAGQYLAGQQQNSGDVINAGNSSDIMEILSQFI